MSLKNKISQAVKKAFKATDDIPLVVDYVSVTPLAYDPDTDALTTTTVVLEGMQAISTRLKEQEIDWFPTDINTQRLLIAGVDFVGVTPKASDYVILPGNVRWEVKRVNQVPGFSLFVLFIQEP